jgi:hypothetical protein
MRLRGSVFVGLTAAVLCSMGSSAWAGVLITINKSTQHMTVSVDGVKRYTWPVSTGRSGYDTPSGSYTPFRMEQDHYSKEWDDAPMPHSIFFTKIGHAIHGSYETKRLGSPASHGCVRLAPQNASTLFALVKAQGLGNTKVVLTGEAPPMVARRPAQPQAAREPMDLRQYRAPSGEQRGYRPYGTPSQPQYAEEPHYQRPSWAQPRDQQPYAVDPRYRQPGYGMQPYESRYQNYDPRFGPRY